ncbi:MAG TPA: type II secretion system protein [Solirubrobacteraceae bacterium]|jgi:Tfp pilus assembly protein PilV
MRFIDRLVRRLRAERGMTIIELLVSASICAVGIAATIGVMDQSRQTSVKAEQRDAMAHQAERELERLMALPWLNFQHSALPVSSASPAGNPSTYISGTSYKYDRKDASASEPLVYSTANGQVEPSYTAWNDNQSRLSGRVYRYITRIDANSRRVTVVVTADGAKAPTPLLLSSIKTKPIL